VSLAVVSAALFFCSFFGAAALSLREGVVMR
jgi:hypothetical protein